MYSNRWNLAPLSCASLKLHVVMSMLWLMVGSTACSMRPTAEAAIVAAFVNGTDEVTSTCEFITSEPPALAIAFWYSPSRWLMAVASITESVGMYITCCTVTSMCTSS